jgi:hypothetical protein
MKEASTRTATLAKASSHALRRVAGLALFSAGWLLWMRDMASWTLSS